MGRLVSQGLGVEDFAVHDGHAAPTVNYGTRWALIWFAAFMRLDRAAAMELAATERERERVLWN